MALDVRVLQGEDALRGIGHYTRGLAEGLLRLASSDQTDVEYVLLVATGRPRPDLRTDGAVAVVEVEAPGTATPRRTGGAPSCAGSAAEGLMERLAGHERGAGALLRAARTARARVLHVASPLHGPFPWAPWRAGCTAASFYDLIPWLHAEEFLERWSPEARRRYRRRVARLARLDALFAISQSAAEDVVAHAGVHRERVNEAYPGLRDVFLKPAARPEEKAAGATGSPRATPYVLAFASTNPSKNTPLLLSAWRRLPPAARAGHVLRLVVPAGSGGEPAWREADNSTVVVEAPDDTALAALYARATCFVCPSQAVGFGLPPLEAAAAGAPVIASSIAVLREVLGDAAEYFSPGSAEDLAGVLGRVVGDASLRAGLSARGQARAREFTWERTAREVARVHARLGRTGSCCQ